MGSNEPKRPNSFKRLKQLIDRQTIRLSDTAKAKTFRKNFIAGVLGQMIQMEPTSKEVPLSRCGIRCLNREYPVI